MDDPSAFYTKMHKSISAIVSAKYLLVERQTSAKSFDDGGVAVPTVFRALCARSPLRLTISGTFLSEVGKGYARVKYRARSSIRVSAFVGYVFWSEKPFFRYNGKYRD